MNQKVSRPPGNSRNVQHVFQWFSCVPPLRSSGFHIIFFTVMHHNQAASLLDKDLKKKPRSDVQRAKWRWAMGNGMEMSSDELLDLSESNT